MKKIILSAAAVLLLTAAGCSNQNDAGKNEVDDAEIKGEQTRQLRVNEKTDTTREKRPQDIQKEIRSEEVAEDNPALYTNERTKKIERRLMDEHDIKAAQVGMTKEKVMIGLMLQKKIRPDLEEKVQRIVNDMEPGKEVIIYTDEIEWNKRKDEGIIR